MGLYSQNRLVNISENAQEYAEIFEFYNNIKVDQNTPSIHEVCMMAANLHFATESFDQLLNESVFLEKEGESIGATNERMTKRIKELDNQEKGSEKLIDTNGMGKALNDKRDYKKEQEEKSGDNKEAKEDEKKENSGASKPKKKISDSELFQKISDLLHKFAEAIQRVFKKISSKLTALKDVDAKVAAKYREYLESWDKYSKGFEGVSLDPADVKTYLDLEKVTYNKDEISFSAKIASEYITKIQNANDVGTISSLKNECLGKIDNGKQIAEENEKTDSEGHKPEDGKTYHPTQDDLNKALEVVQTGLGTALQGVNDVSDSAKEALKSLELSAKKAFNGTSKDEEIEYARNKAIFEIYKKAAKKVGRDFSVNTKKVTKQYTIARKIVVTCGKYAKEQTKANNEGYEFDEYIANVEAFMFGESSDMFLESVFDVFTEDKSDIAAAHADRRSIERHTHSHNYSKDYGKKFSGKQSKEEYESHSNRRNYGTRNPSMRNVMSKNPNLSSKETKEEADRVNNLRTKFHNKDEEDRKKERADENRSKRREKLGKKTSELKKQAQSSNESTSFNWFE